MKKLLSLILSLFMVLGVSTVTFAADTYTDEASIDFAKIYKLLNDNVDSPDETFNFTIKNYSVTDSQYTIDGSNGTDIMPSIKPNSFSIHFANGEANLVETTEENGITFVGNKKTANIKLPTYAHVGIFTYEITETAGSTAGVTYDKTPLYLVVTVSQGENGLVRTTALHYGNPIGNNKVDGITNTYSAGSLAITKNVTGNMGEKDRYFEVYVTLNAPTETTEDGKEVVKPVNSIISISGGSYENNPTSITVGTPTKFYLKDDETIIIKNIPYDVTYEVEEEDYTGDNYKEEVYTFSNSDKKIKSANETVNITNERVTNVDTGILVDNLPYIIILAGVAVGMGVFFMKKRTANNN